MASDEPAAAASPARGSWQRIDLAGRPPSARVSGSSVAVPADGVRTEERALDRGLAARAGTTPGRPFLGAAGVRALVAPPGTTLTWRLRRSELGDHPYLSFVPLADPDCPTRFQVEIDSTVLFDAEPDRPSAHHPPATVELDLVEALAERAESDLELRLVTRRVRPCEVQAIDPAWGVPVVWSRGGTGSADIASPERPNLVLIGFDTLRADHLGAWGRRPSVTPALDQLAAESDVWSAAHATFNVTNPSFASILTGLWGKRHGVYELSTPLGEEHTTLAERLRAAGYRTHAVVSAPHLAPTQSGLGQGFDDYRHFWTRQEAAVSTVDGALTHVLEENGLGESTQPFFLFVHLFDPHTPHKPPARYARGDRPRDQPVPGAGPVAGWTRSRADGPEGVLPFDNPILGGRHEHYLGEIAAVDREIGRLLDVLRSRGQLEHTVVAAVADHGENFGEQGIQFRHTGLWDATTHVPLLIRRPGTSPGKGRVFSGLVQTIDLFPTLLGLLGLPLADDEAEAIDGRDLYSLGERGRRAVFAEASGSGGGGEMVRTRERLYARFAQDGRPKGLAERYAFDLRTDPAQERNLAAEPAGSSGPDGATASAVPEGFEDLDALLDRWLADRGGARAPSIDLAPEERERLRALGYVLD